MTSDHLSKFALEALALSALEPEESKAAELHLGGCGDCQAAWATLREERSRFQAAGFPPALHARATATKRRLSLAWMAVPALAAALATLVVALPGLRKPAEPDYGIKGSDELQIYARRGDNVFPVAEGVGLYPGDQIRFVVNPKGLAYVLIASVDSAGKVTVYVPFDGKESAKLPAGGSQELSGSIVLDQALGPERVFALFSAQPLDAEPVKSALGHLGSEGAEAIRKTEKLDVPGEVQASVHFEKLSEKGTP